MYCTTLTSCVAQLYILYCTTLASMALEVNWKLKGCFKTLFHATFSWRPRRPGCLRLRNAIATSLAGCLVELWGRMAPLGRILINANCVHAWWVQLFVYFFKAKSEPFAIQALVQHGRKVINNSWFSIFSRVTDDWQGVCLTFLAELALQEILYVLTAWCRDLQTTDLSHFELHRSKPSGSKPWHLLSQLQR